MTGTDLRYGNERLMCELMTCDHDSCAYERGSISLDEFDARSYEIPLDEYLLLKRAFEVTV